MQQLMESIQSGESEVRRIYEAANILGLDVVKLIWHKTGASTEKIAGFDVPVRDFSNKVNPLSEDGMVIPMVGGVVQFFADKNKFKWGYVIATENNMKALASHLKKGWYKINDKQYANDAVDYATERGWATAKGARSDIQVRKTVNEKAAEERALRAEKEAREAQAELAKARKEVKESKVETEVAKMNATKEAPKIDKVELGDDGNPVTLDSVETPKKSSRKRTTKK